MRRRVSGPGGIRLVQVGHEKPRSFRNGAGSTPAAWDELWSGLVCRIAIGQCGSGCGGAKFGSAGQSSVRQGKVRFGKVCPVKAPNHHAVGAVVGFDAGWWVC